MKSEEIVTTPPASAEPVPEEAMLYCPVCDQKLFQRKCKLLCGRCGYYMSCADYY
jgi:hypothetical protein